MSDDPHAPDRVQRTAEISNRGYISGSLDTMAGMLAAIRDGTLDEYVADAVRRLGAVRVNAALVEHGLPPVGG